MFERIKEIITPEDVKKILPLSENGKRVKSERDSLLKKIISGLDDRKVMIVGPCSADNEVAVLDYMSRLARISEQVKDKLFIVPRIYTNKPRTRGDGYKGIFHNPNPCKGTDIQEGIMAMRHMHIKSIEETGLSAADEMLYPENYDYLEDLLTYVAVGARSSENQQHRLVASGVDVPVGVKNPMFGSMSVLLNSIYAAQIPNEFKYGKYQVKTAGNAYAHAVLRGGVDSFGNNIPNYHYEDVIKFYDMYKQQNLKNPAVIIDVNHSNSNKNPFEQIRIVKEIISNMNSCDKFKELVKGFMVESYIEDGNQSPDGSVYGKSITDGCLGWDKTRKLIFDVAEHL
ncbi:MAG: 3-deoxy-7-phosphoheptulonate synthase [Clostridia bacterium]|jgi:3-deoxy-7-phosphoheptulonate synthase|nr:3-deoxy-7-phosphoheptulonate synthase [Clostridia bacterium]